MEIFQRTVLTVRNVRTCSEFTKLFQQSFQKIAIRENLDPRKFSTIRGQNWIVGRPRNEAMENLYRSFDSVSEI